MHVALTRRCRQCTHTIGCGPLLGCRGRCPPPHIHLPKAALAELSLQDVQRRAAHLALRINENIGCHSAPASTQCQQRRREFVSANIHIVQNLNRLVQLKEHPVATGAIRWRTINVMMQQSAPSPAEAPCWPRPPWPCRQQAHPWARSPPPRPPSPRPAAARPPSACCPLAAPARQRLRRLPRLLRPQSDPHPLLASGAAMPPWLRGLLPWRHGLARLLRLRLCLPAPRPLLLLLLASSRPLCFVSP